MHGNNKLQIQEFEEEGRDATGTQRETSTIYVMFNFLG